MSITDIRSHEGLSSADIFRIREGSSDADVLTFRAKTLGFSKFMVFRTDKEKGG